MPSTDFRKLIDEICRLSKLPHPQALYHQAALNIDGVDISLLEREGPIGELIIYCDLGALPTRQREETLLRLLEFNFHLFICSSDQRVLSAQLISKPVAPL